MPGGQAPLKNTGPVTEAGPPLSARSAWPFTAAPIPPAPINGGGVSRANVLAASQGGLPIDVPPLSDMWQVMLDGRLLFGRGSGIGISAYTGLGLPDQRTTDVALPSEHGVVALGDYYTARQLVFNLCINARELADCGGGDASTDPAAAAAWDALRYIAGVWQARTTDVLLEMRMTTGQSYMLLGRPRKFDADTSLLRKGQLAVAAEFIATDPRMYATQLAQRTLQLASPDDPSLSTWCLQAGTPVTPGGQPSQMVTPVGTAVQIGNGFSSSAGQTFWPLTSLVTGVAWNPSSLVAAATTPAGASRIRANSGTEALPAGATTLTFGVQQFADSGPWGWAAGGQSFTPTADLDQMGRVKMGRTDGSVNIAWAPGTYLRLMDGAAELARVTVPATGAGMPLELPFDYTFRAGRTYSVQINLPAPATVWTLSGIGGHSDGMYAFYSRDRIALPPFGVGSVLTPPAAGDWVIKGSVRTGTNPLGQSLTLLRNGLPIANGWMAAATNGLAEFTTSAPVHFNPGDWLALVGLGNGNSNVTQLAAADGIAPGVTLTPSGGTAPVDPGGGFCTSQAPWGDSSCAISLPLVINGEATLTNRGNTDSLPIVTFFGPAEHPTILNATSDRLLGLAYDLLAGEQVQVNMRTREVFKGDAPTTPRYDLLASAADFWPLIPGENDVRLRHTGREATAATITWRDAWL
jgi:hypothetical protein